MSEIKAIETVYKGYRFRSRLEARWAVFFDACGIKYEYEPEGFDLDGKWYLPDFYLTDYMLFVEIKPFDKKIVSYIGDNNEWERLCRKFRDLTGKAILLCYGDPATDSYKRLFAFDTTYSSGGCSEFQALFTTFDCKTVLVTEPDRRDREIFIDEYHWTQSDYIGTPYNFAKDKWLLWDRAMECLDIDGKIPEWDITSLAKIEARQARFEHGEKPKGRTK